MWQQPQLGRSQRLDIKAQVPSGNCMIWCRVAGQKLLVDNDNSVCHKLRPKAEVQAKKKGGGKKKQAGSLMDPPKPANPYLEASVIMHNLLMVESYKRKVGK